VPEAITNQVYQAAVKVLKNPEIVKLLAAEGAVAVGNTPAEFDAFVRSELVAWAKLIRDMNL
jgi:tripartite-type tricarboxylate transporter receptor subunit TctC